MRRPAELRIVPKRARPGPPANRLVVVVAYDGLCTFEFGCAVEVFGLMRPEMGEGWYRFTVAAVEKGPLCAAGGVRVLVDGGAELIAEAGTVIVPGWRGATEPVPEELCAALRAAHAKGARILSLCSGVFVLAAAGLLDGRRATTHWRYFEALAARHPDLCVVPDVLYVDEGDVLTAAGSAAGLDLCLHLIRRDFGPAAANSVAERLVVPAHRDGDRAQRLARPVPRERAGGSLLAATLERVRARLAEAWPIARLAAEAATSPRGLHRRFRDAVGLAPGAWLLAERVARARDLLETTTLPVEEVALMVGFGDVQALRRHLHRRTGLSPKAYRDRFRRDAGSATAA
jgi:AraC family transcriptional activator FtrA